jgi:pimeloyl-ACP methyl ester carboxylesterase
MADLVEIPVTHNGVTMHAVAVGAGPPVLLVHGFAQSHLTWRANFDALAAHYRVLAVDLPGFGASTKVALDGLEAFGDTLLRLLDREHLDSAHVVALLRGPRGAWLGAAPARPRAFPHRAGPSRPGPDGYGFP